MTPDRIARPGWYTWAAMFASSLVLALGALLIALHQNAESDRKAEAERIESERKWCSIVVTLNDAYREQPPTTPTGKNVAAGIAELKRSLDCPPVGVPR